jgi:hypothetical protein
VVNETLLRFQGLIGRLKPGAVFGALVAVVVLLAGASNFSLASKNQDSPYQVTISQLVNGDIGDKFHVTVSGIALYDTGYEESENGRITRNYYFLIDPDTADMILVEHHSAQIDTTETENAITITGMTHSTPSDLENLIKEDTEEFDSYGVATTSELYIKDGATPPNIITGLVMMGIGGPAFLLCLLTFFFPTIVFNPHPVDTTAMPTAGRPSIKATGRFQQLRQMQPSLEIGRRTQKFANAVANVVLIENRRLMVYIHHIVKTKTYGVTVSTQESHWGIPLDRNNVRAVTPGKIYGWQDEWAVRFQYHNPQGKLETLYVIFEQPGAQVELVKLLGKMGFMVTTSSMML